MTESDNRKPISSFDEICRVTIETMQKMDMETLLSLKKQAIREYDRAKLTKGCIELALSLKAQDQERAALAEEENQLGLLD